MTWNKLEPSIKELADQVSDYTYEMSYSSQVEWSVMIFGRSESHRCVKIVSENDTLIVYRQMGGWYSEHSYRKTAEINLNDPELFVKIQAIASKWLGKPKINTVKVK